MEAGRGAQLPEKPKGSNLRARHRSIRGLPLEEGSPMVTTPLRRLATLLPRILSGGLLGCLISESTMPRR